MDKLPKANDSDIELLLSGKLKRYRVKGDSMVPTLMSGDEVVVDPTAEMKTNDVVVARHPFKIDVTTIKRVREIDENGRYYLTGDNPAGSTDSRSLGAFAKKLVIGKVVAKLMDLL